MTFKNSSKSDQLRQSANFENQQTFAKHNLQEDFAMKELTLDAYLQSAYQYLEDLASSSELATVLETAFGNNYDQNVAQALFTQFSAQDFSSIPKVKILSSDIFGNANGAYATETNQIFLNQDFLAQNQNSPEVIVNVLLEEIGHFIDAQINTEDSAGDEGDIFARLVQGETLSAEILAQLKTEDDSKTIVLGGEEIAIEQIDLNSDDDSDLDADPSIRVSTWNVFHGDINGESPVDRIRDLLDFGEENEVDVMAFQEVPLSRNSETGQLEPDSELQGLIDQINTDDSRYNAELFFDPINGEYPSDSQLALNTAQRTDAYLYIYNNVDFHRQEPIDFVEPDQFHLNGLSQGRPPVRLSLTSDHTNHTFHLDTWHNEASIAANAVPQLETYNNLVGSSSGDLNSTTILFGDLNVRMNHIDNEILPDFNGVSDGLDHILADGEVTEYRGDSRSLFHSDAHHYAMFADIEPTEDSDSDSQASIDGIQLQLSSDASDNDDDSDFSPFASLSSIDSTSFSTLALANDFSLTDQNTNQDILDWKGTIGIGTNIVSRENLFSSLFVSYYGNLTYDPNKDGKIILNNGLFYADIGTYRELPLFSGNLTLDPL